MQEETFTKFASTIQWDDLSKIHDLFAVALKLLRGTTDPMGTAVPSLRTTVLNLSLFIFNKFLDKPLRSVTFLQKWLGVDQH